MRQADPQREFPGDDPAFRPDHEGVPLGGRTPSGEEQPVPEPPVERGGLGTLGAVKSSPRIAAFITAADDFLGAQGFTEHGFRHANLVGHIARNVLLHLGHDPRTARGRVATPAAFSHLGLEGGGGAGPTLFGG